MAEAGERREVPSAALRGLIRTKATFFDRLLEAVREEHVREAKSWRSSSADRRRECVKSLLAGELVDHSELGYELDAHRLALMAKGETARSTKAAKHACGNSIVGSGEGKVEVAFPEQRPFTARVGRRFSRRAGPRAT